MPSGSAILLLCSEAAEAVAIEDLLGEAVVAKKVKSLQELRRVLIDDFHWDVLLCAWSFQDGTWRDVLLHVQSHVPCLPVVIFCGSGVEREWSEVRKSGAFDLLTTPYRERTVLRVIEHAIASCETWRLQTALQVREPQKTARDG